jgi:tyrosine-protein kinase Etk/Wzc
LAAAAAARGKRVLIVDADLRRGRLHTLFRMSKRGGLFELATQQISGTEATRGTSIPNVDAITCGDVPEKVSPVRVLELPELRRAIAELKARYDLILIDTAPVPMVSDVLVLGDLVDGAVGVFRAGQTSTRLGREMTRQLAFARLNFIGWVLNGVSEAELKKRYYYRKYGYASGYQPDGGESA